jgi:hypothetical protein
MSRSEINGFMDEDYVNKFPEEGGIFIEATIAELAERKIGTACGLSGNNAFIGLSSNPIHSSRVVRALHCPALNGVGEMVHIQCENKKTANEISKSVDKNGGSLRVEGKSKWPGFWEFEVE